VLIEDRIAKADVVAIAWWDEAPKAAVYEVDGERRVYVRRRLHVSEVVVGALPRRTNLLVRGGACFDRDLERYVVDDEEVVYLPPGPGEFIVLLKHVTGRDYELVDGSRGFLSGPIDRAGQAMTFIATRRKDLLPPGSVVAAKTPSPDTAAARVSMQQLREILNRLSTESSRAKDATNSPRPRLIAIADLVDRKTIVEELAIAADRYIASETGAAFFRDHLIREDNPQWIPQPIGGRHVHQPSEEWRGIAVAYRLRAFGKTSETAAFSVAIGPDRSLFGTERIPHCEVDAGACEFRVDEAMARRIARDHGLEEVGFPWKANLYWDLSCRAFVWSIMNFPPNRESEVIQVTSGSGKVCGRQSITSISSGVPRPDLEPPPTKEHP
jgi:hypothetical protein